MSFCSPMRSEPAEALFWDGSGLWVCAKRLEKGRFRWPETTGEESKIVLSHEELTLLLGGIDLAQTRRRAWHLFAINRLPRFPCAFRAIHRKGHGRKIVVPLAHIPQSRLEARIES